MSLRDEVDAAIKAMSWLKDSDGASVALAQTYADQIDAVLDDPEASSLTRTKALYLGPHLLNALRALGGAPAERKELAAGDTVGGKLATLRAIRGGADDGGDAKPKRSSSQRGTRR